MSDYFCGPGGSDAAAGTSYALRRLTLSSIETLLAAGDTVYVAPGVSRELLTCGVSGTAGNPITYIGDVTGAKTDGVGGAVRITGSNDDLTATRASCVSMAARSYRTFRGFQFDTTTGVLLSMLTTAGNNIFEDCVLQPPTANVNLVGIASGVNIVFRRCLFFAVRSYSLQLIAPSVLDNSGHIIENCLFLGGLAGACNIQRVGGMTFRNNLFYACGYGIRITTALSVGQTTTVNNNIFMNCGTSALACTAAAEITEDYNTFWANTADRTTAGVGANSISAPPLFAAPQQLAGFTLAQQSFGLSEWSAIRALVDAGAATDDLYGMARPATSGKRSWGPIQWADQARSTAQAHAGTASWRLADAGRVQMQVPVSNISTMVSVYVYREANYAGTGPQLIVKQQGQSDQAAADAASSGQWNLLTVTFTPSALPTWATVELVSNNTASGASIATFFDDLTVV